MHNGYLYLDASASAEERAEDLLRRMTLEEKVAQLGSIQASALIEARRFSVEKARELLKNGMGQITRVAGSPGVESREAGEIANDVQRFLLTETRLGVPAIVHEECLSGLMAGGATTFPQAIGLASTWNPELVRDIASTVRAQMKATGAHQGLSPVLDVARDPRWGRTEETFGEDPYLVASTGVAYIEGLQGKDYKSGIIATPKHFAAYSFTEGGRNCAPAHVPPRELREVFLFPFEAAVKIAKARSLMNAYHDIDGIPCACSRELLTRILREEWGFEGFVVSDYRSVEMLKTLHLIAADESEAAVRALEAGLDVELPETVCYGRPLIQAIEDGRVSEATLNEAVSRVLRAKFLLGIFENLYVEPERIPKVLDTPDDRALALQAARESIVLLKNDGILPLDKEVGSIAVVGPNADSGRNLLGDYSHTAHFANVEARVPLVAVLDGLRGKVSGKTKLDYAKGCDVVGTATEGFNEAVQAASRSEVVVAVVGERSGLSEYAVSGEGRDRASLRLPGVQEEFVDALCKTGKPVIVVLVNGRPLGLGRVVEKCAAIVEAWFPGEEGGNAVAEVLFGDHNPSGRLPISFPFEVGQVPLYYSRRPSSFREYVFASSRPLFPFGHGLSYTDFQYQSLQVTPQTVGPSGRVSIAVAVRNAGERAGEEVIQLYIRDVVASVARPVKELKGFRKIALGPGEEKTVTFELSTDQLAFYDCSMRLVVEPGQFEVMVGPSSEDARLTRTFEVVGHVKVMAPSRTLFSASPRS